MIAYGSVDYPGYEESVDPETVRSPVPQLTPGARKKGVEGTIIAVRTGNGVNLKRGKVDVEVPDIAILIPCTEEVTRRLIDPDSKRPLIAFYGGAPRPIDKVDPERVCLGYCKDGVSVVCSAPNTRYITVFPHVAYYKGKPYLAFQGRRLPWGFTPSTDEKFSFTFEIRDFNKQQ